MYDAFKKWSMHGHTFTFLKLTAAEVESLGAATQQFLEPEDNTDGAAMVRGAGGGGAGGAHSLVACLSQLTID